MKDGMDEALNNVFGSRSNNYTMDEIAAARKRQRAQGGTLLDNLVAVTGHGLAPVKNPDLGSMLADAGIDITEPVLEKELDTFKKQLESEYWGRKVPEATAEVKNDTPAGAATVETAAAETAETCEDSATALTKFAGVADEVAQTVFGQQEYINKLVIAFKRPFVMPAGENPIRNSIFITGPDNTGRTSALEKLAEVLAKKSVLKSSSISTMDLALYPGTSEEKLFWQDLYSVLCSKNEIVVFVNYEGCHTSYLSAVAALVTKGSCRMSARYILQNGQLVGITNSLASDTVGSLSAEGKYLVFISEKSSAKLANAFGAPFVNALGDICETKPLNEEAYLAVSKREYDKLVATASTKLLYNIESGEDFIKLGAARSEKQRGISGILTFYNRLYKALAKLRLEKDHPAGMKITLLAKESRAYAVIDGEELDLESILGENFGGELEQVKEELNEIIGLKDIKEYVLGLENYYKMQQLRREEGLKVREISKHMIFTGNPGTGKTTIARLISRYLKAIGVLTGGQLVEVTRAELVGQYVGQTAPLVNKVIESALGGVLFVDEAYALHHGRDDSFGQEAIDALVKGIEDNRDNLIVILAGYSYEMSVFLDTNSGLKSRFPNIIEFPDYSGEELVKIAQSIAKSMGYTIEEPACEKLRKYFENVQAERAHDAGNGRLARNCVEDAVLKQAGRTMAEGGDLSLLTEKDFCLEEEED